MTGSDPQDAVPEQTPAAAQDMSEFIRTYAKDVAHITGKGNVAAVQKPHPVATPVPNIQIEKEVRPTGIQSAAVSQPLQDSSVAPTPTIPERGALAQRESILARLRTKMTPVPPAPEDPAFVPVPTPVSAPVFSEAPPEAVHPLPPLSKEPSAAAFTQRQSPSSGTQKTVELYREPIPESVHAVEPANVRAPATPPSVPTDASERFHSYSTDFKDNVSKTGASTFSVLAAEQDAVRSAESPTPQKRTGHGLFPVIAGMLLLAGAGGALYAGYLYLGARTVVPTITLSVPSLIFADEYIQIEGRGVELQRALALVADRPITTGTAVVTYIAQPATGETGVIAGAPAPGGYLVQALDLPAPDLLLRNSTQDSTVGVLREGGETRAFFVLRVSSYERTFAGMLTWEPLMMRDMGLLYPLYPEVATEESVVDLSATTTNATASSTPHTSTPPAVSRGRFDDAIVANRDVRILRDTRGRSLLLYGYADKETLIIARNEAAFAALITRLAAKSN